jgi:hypothetical protein
MTCFLVSFGLGVATGWLLLKRPEWVGWVLAWIRAQFAAL